MPATAPVTNDLIPITVFTTEGRYLCPVVELDQVPLSAGVGAGEDPQPWAKYSFADSWEGVVIAITSRPDLIE